jgi:hypothetical protein
MWPPKKPRFGGAFFWRLDRSGDRKPEIKPPLLPLFQVLGYVDATDAQAAETVAAEQFRLDGWQRRRLLVWELG